MKLLRDLALVGLLTVTGCDLSNTGSEHPETTPRSTTPAVREPNPEIGPPDSPPEVPSAEPAAPPIAEDSEKPGPMGEVRRSRMMGIEGTPKEVELRLKDPARNSGPLLGAHPNARSEPTLRPEEKVGWEWIDVLPDLRVALVPERSEIGQRPFTLAWIEFPPDLEPYQAIRAEAITAIETWLAGQRIELRGDPNIGVSLRTPEGWLDEHLLERGLAWARLPLDMRFEVETAGRITRAIRSAREEKRGLWAIVGPALEKPWTLSERRLHLDPNCGEIASPGDAVPPASMLDRGIPPCLHCFPR